MLSAFGSTQGGISQGETEGGSGDFSGGGKGEGNVNVGAFV